MSALLALLPIFVILVLMVGFHRSAALAAGVGLAVAVAVGFGAFGADGAMLAGVAAEAGFTALTILWIVFAALCLHELQVHTGAVATLRGALTRLSDDRRVLAILVAWFFALFIEGAAGFGTPAALAAPMLVSVGFPPLQAVTIALIGHAPGVSFGAVGTPVLPQIAATEFGPIPLAAAVATLHGALGWVVMVFLVRHAGDGMAAGTAGGPVWRQAVPAAVLFLAPYLAIALLVGPELPTLGGALVGGLLFVWWLRRGAGTAVDTSGGERGVLWAGLPYLVIVALILLTRLVPDLKEAAREVEIAWTLPGGFSGSFQPLYHPGTMLLAGFLIGGAAQGAGAAGLLAAMGRAARRLPMVAVALVAMLALARLMVQSGMIPALAEAAAAGLGPAWPLLAPWVGILGSFVTGSATASNILFTDFQEATAAALNLPALPLLGAQNFGAAVGNMICPHNIIAACAVVGLAGQEGAVLRRTILACAVYALMGGALTWAILALG